MPVSEEHREDVARKLTLLGEGFLELADVDGVPCVAMAPEARLAVPAGSVSLFLRLGLPLQRPGSAPVGLMVEDEQGSCRHREDLAQEDCWLAVPVQGARELVLRLSASFPSSAVGRPSGAPLGALLRDLEFTSGELRPTYDLASADRDGGRFLTVRLDLTNKCNMRCRMCPLSFDEIFYQRKSYVSVEDFRRYADRILPRTAQLSLSVAYEPLLHPRFAEILGIVARHRVPFVDFTTNGTLMSEELVDAFVDHGVNRVTVSVDGAAAATYEHIRRGVDFERFLEGLKTFQRVRSRRGSKTPELSFNMVLMRSNIGELPDVIRLGHRYGLDIMHACLLVPHVGLKMEHEALQHDRERANRLLEEARSVARELGIPCQLPEAFDLSLPEEPVEALPVTPEYTLAEDWRHDRPRTRTLTGRRRVTEGEHEREQPAPDAPSPPPSREPPRIPEYRVLASLPVPAGSAPLPEPRSVGGAQGATMMPAGHASSVKEARDGDGRVVDAACVYPWTMALVDAGQQVTPCCYWYDYTRMGDLGADSFEDVWNGPEYRRLRLELQTGRYRPCCQSCPERRPI